MSNSYAGIKRDFKDDAVARKRCAARLLKLRERLAPLRQRKTDTTLLLATWNIRDFDSNKFRWGPRLAESFYYIAEFISAFDLVAVQEVNEDLSPLRKVIRILGREWDYIVTDVTEGGSGNGERMAYIYNTEKIWFRKVAGEVVLPKGHTVVAKKKVVVENQTDLASETVESQQQFARSPFLVAFQSGWFRFSLCTVHIYFGEDSGEKLARRVAEIKDLVSFFAKRQDSTEPDKDQLGETENYILLGDFNVVSPEHETIKALKAKGFKVPEQIDGDKIRPLGHHFYDQIAVRVKDPRFKVTSGGIVPLFEDVFRDEDMDLYQQHVPAQDPEAKAKYKAKTPDGRYKKWRTWQLSDHSPLWVEIQTDFADDYLKGIAEAP